VSQSLGQNVAILSNAALFPTPQTNIFSPEIADDGTGWQQQFCLTPVSVAFNNSSLLGALFS